MLEKLTFPSNAKKISPQDILRSSHFGMFLKIVLRRADCYNKLEEYEECIQDYILAQEIKPDDYGNITLTKTLNGH